MQNEKKVTPTDPGVWFTGNTEAGDFTYQVIIAPHSFLSHQALEEFYRWKSFAKCEKTLSLILKMYFQFITSLEGNLSLEEKEELMLFTLFMAKLTEDDQERLRKDQEELLNESLK